MQQNCHSYNFLDQLRGFPPPFGQSPSGLPITQDFCLMHNGKVDWEQWTISCTRCQLIQSIKAMLMGAWIYFLKSSFQINMLTLEELNILEKSRSVHSMHACIIMVCFKNLSYRAFNVAKYKSSFLVSQWMHLIFSNGKIQKEFITYMKSPLSHSTSRSLFHSILKWLWPSQEPSSCH